MNKNQTRWYECQSYEERDRKTLMSTVWPEIPNHKVHRMVLTMPVKTTTGRASLNRFKLTVSKLLSRQPIISFPHERAMHGTNASSWVRELSRGEADMGCWCTKRMHGQPAGRWQV